MTTTDNAYCLELAQRLIQRPSLTPHDAHCMDLICEALEPVGFRSERMPCGEVENLWLRKGEERPIFCFVGHTDVVPTGPEEEWRYPPFSATLASDKLWGRGAADMKGSIAAIVAAIRQFVAGREHQKGSIALLLTSDEEGPAIDGVAHALKQLKKSEQIPDWALIGEPSSNLKAADRIRIGRRGSLHCHLVIRGLQGHVAYPDKVKNPIHGSAPLLDALAQEDWSRNEKVFPPTSLQITHAQAGTGALNVVPGTFSADFNLRHSPDLPAAQIRQRVQQLVEQHIPAAAGLKVEMQWTEAADPFLGSNKGPLQKAAVAAANKITGRTPELSTDGGTSDGRFMAAAGAEVVELGPCVETIHMVDECVTLEDLEITQACYLEVLRGLCR